MNTQELIWKIGVEPSHWDGLGNVVQPSWDTLQAVIGSLGMEIDSAEDLPALLERIELERKCSCLASVYTGDSGRETWLKFSRANDFGSGRLHLAVKPEGQEETVFTGYLEDPDQEGCSIPPLPAGYYRVELEAGEKREGSLLVIAPRRAYQGDESERKWGFFCPLYALDNPSGFGSGDYLSFRDFVTWMAAEGGGLLGTLPLFPAFLEAPCDPSPYAPVSRLFWNEFYVDPRSAPNWNDCKEARALYSSDAFQDTLRRLKGYPTVEFREEMGIRRELLEILSRDFFIRGGGQLPGSFADYLHRNSEVMEYAKFRADIDSRPLEPAGLIIRGVGKPEKDFQESLNYHLYSQWLAETQLNGLREHASNQGVEMYLDLPLGVHPEGYDAFAFRGIFAEGVSGGAPPDAFFSRGQDWGFRPMHPWKSRENGHWYFRRIIRKLMEVSDLIRLDHVMSLHRLYWVPLGMPADRGAYVRYPADELYAILRLESHLRRCVVVGEDLGTVPQEVRSTMDDQGMLRMYVGQFAVRGGDGPALEEPVSSMVASVNTHDTPTFSGFSQGLDIVDRVELGILSEGEVEAEMGNRQGLLARLAGELGLVYPGLGTEWKSMLPEVFRRLILRLSGSRARYLMVNLEDLWLEESPQNVPGTGFSQKPNWKQRMKWDFERIRRDSGIEELLTEIDRSRNP